MSRGKFAFWVYTLIQKQMNDFQNMNDKVRSSKRKEVFLHKNLVHHKRICVYEHNFWLLCLDVNAIKWMAIITFGESALKIFFFHLCVSLLKCRIFLYDDHNINFILNALKQIAMTFLSYVFTVSKLYSDKLCPSVIIKNFNWISSSCIFLSRD